MNRRRRETLIQLRISKMNVNRRNKCPLFKIVKKNPSLKRLNASAKFFDPYNIYYIKRNTSIFYHKIFISQLSEICEYNYKCLITGLGQNLRNKLYMENPIKY